MLLPSEPPDGGFKVEDINFSFTFTHCLNTTKFFKAWSVLFCSSLINGTVFGIHQTFGILFAQLRSNMVGDGDEHDAAFKCSLIGMTKLMDPNIRCQTYFLL